MSTFDSWPTNPAQHYQFTDPPDPEDEDTAGGTNALGLFTSASPSYIDNALNTPPTLDVPQFGDQQAAVLHVNQGKMSHPMNNVNQPSSDPREETAQTGYQHQPLNSAQFAAALPTQNTGGLSTGPFQMQSWSPSTNSGNEYMSGDAYLSDDFGPFSSNYSTPDFQFGNVPLPGDEYNHLGQPSMSIENHDLSAPTQSLAQNYMTAQQSEQNLHRHNLDMFNAQATTNGRGLSPQLMSPIVRVENYSNENVATGAPTARSPSLGSHGSRRSPAHLSPYNVENVGDEDVHETPTAQRSVNWPSLPTLRNDDGSWQVPEASGHGGIAPDSRKRLNEDEVPSLNELDSHRLKVERNADVEDWLTNSDVGSEGEPDRAVTSRRRKSSTANQRARSASGVSRKKGTAVRVADARQLQSAKGSAIPGPGVLVDVDSEEEESVASDSSDGDRVETPPVAVNVRLSEEEDSYFPPPADDNQLHTTVSSPPWGDTTAGSETDRAATHQPPTSNAAMMRFRQRARDLETASLAATIGSRASRRMSESDLSSLLTAGGVARTLPVTRDNDKSRPRKGSFLEHILPKRATSSRLKRKDSAGTTQAAEAQQTQAAQRDRSGTLEPPKRIPSWGRSKSPAINTNLSAASANSKSAGVTPTLSSPGPWQQAKNVIKRSRSRSDLPKSLGLRELMTQHGGPPMLALAPSHSEEGLGKPSNRPTGEDEDSEDDEDDDMPRGQEVFQMDLTIRADQIAPTDKGFKSHVCTLNPRLPHYMIDRVTQEQVKRYKRLVEWKLKHQRSVENGRCSSNDRCFALGGKSIPLAPRAASKDGEVPFAGFRVVAPGSADIESETTADGALIVAQFPPGVPLPPVKRLPAEFECSLCFKVKKFYKPSDWTKHVHEDLQPFTCTFPLCNEPKSFKRKADWVRHESERHRQLESWICNQKDCSHVCYRKDNFVQHLVREHKVPEPRVRPTRSTGGRGRGNSNAGDGVTVPSNTLTSEEVWVLVDSCRRESKKQPADEPCRFCGNSCKSWKKLTVHLAKHMEQISMPILRMIEGDLSAGSSSALNGFPQQLSLRTQPTPFANSRNASQEPIGYSSNLKVDPTSAAFENRQEGHPSFAASSQTSQYFHSYPPPQISPNAMQNLMQPRAVQPPANLSVSYATQSYPGVTSHPQHTGATGYQDQQQMLLPTQLTTQYGYSTPNQGQYPGSVSPLSAYGEEQVYSSPVESSAPPFDALRSTYYQGQIPSGPQEGSSRPNAPAYGGLAGLQYAAQPAYGHPSQASNTHYPHTFNTQE